MSDSVKRWLRTHPLTQGVYRVLYNAWYSHFFRKRICQPRLWLRTWKAYSFDRRHGTDTQTPMDPHEYDLSRQEYRDGTVYGPSNVTNFQRVLALLPIEQTQTIFLDIGSGKGLALLLAADFPFKQIIGVEYSPLLHSIAQRNIQVYRGEKQRCFQLTTFCSNVLDFQFPKNDLIIYLYNPFGRETMQGFLERLQSWFQAESKALFILYFNPVQHPVIAATSFLVDRTEALLKTVPDWAELGKHYKIYQGVQNRQGPAGGVS